MTEEQHPASAQTATCLECGRELAEGEERVDTEQGAFCPTCFSILKSQIDQAVEAQGRDVNFFMAFLGGVGGGALGATVWWGFTVLTDIPFGLVAIVIGFAVARGILMATGGKRSRGLQALSVSIAGVSFFYAGYLVNRSSLLKFSSEYAALPYLPDPQLLFRVVSLGFGIMDFVFFAIVIWEAWRGVAPIQLESAR